MKLYLDMGNTRTKWCLLHNQRETYGFCDKGDWRGLEKQIRLLLTVDGAVEKVVVACVTSEKSMEELKAWSFNAFARDPIFATVSECFAGVTACYADLPRLGVDRWLAMLAGFNECRSRSIIIDAGSALTIDYLAADGRHMGGVILPGPGLMQKALNLETSNIKLDSIPLSEQWVPGCNTVACVGAGIGGAIEGLLAKALAYDPPLGDNERLGREGLLNSKGQSVYVTGGDAKLIRPWCGEQPQMREHMVLQGLKLWDTLSSRI